MSKIKIQKVLKWTFWIFLIIYFWMSSFRFPLWLSLQIHLCFPIVSAPQRKADKPNSIYFLSAKVSSLLADAFVSTRWCIRLYSQIRSSLRVDAIVSASRDTKHPPAYASKVRSGLSFSACPWALGAVHSYAEYARIYTKPIYHEILCPFILKQRSRGMCTLWAIGCKVLLKSIGS